MSGAKVYDKLLEKATSQYLLEVDWESILKICDLIRQGDVQPRYVIGQIRKKFSNENIHVVHYSLLCLESIVKNCGSKVHQEIAAKEFMDLLRSLASSKPDPVKSKVLELIQCWSHAFKKNPNYKIVEDYFNAMKLEGFQFPVLREADAMFDVEEAPQWVHDSESTSCYRCRAEFSTLKRRHHCRCCGQIFCHACSSKQAPIPKYGIEKEVRVCDVCFDKLTNNAPLPNESDLPIEYLNSALYREMKAAQQATSKTSVSSATTPAATATTRSSTAPKSNEKTEEEFEEELQLALALSQSELEAKKSEKSRKSSTSSSSKTNGSASRSSTSLYTNETSSNATAPYYEPNQNGKQYKENGKATNGVAMTTHVAVEQEDEEEIRVDNEIDTFIEQVKGMLEVFLNRMKSDSMRGRSITNDTAVQSLFLQLQSLQPKLLSYLKYKEDARAYYENLQDKLTQLKDAREALNALRHENYEKKRKELEEKERLRQLQISQKLQFMRQQKQNYYLYQNQLNLQRLQEQERDLQMRLSQQRELVMQRDQHLFNNPSGGAAMMHPSMMMIPPNGQIGAYPMVDGLDAKFQSLQMGYTPQQQWPAQVPGLPQQQQQQQPQVPVQSAQQHLPQAQVPYLNNPNVAGGVAPQLQYHQLPQQALQQQQPPVQDYNNQNYYGYQQASQQQPQQHQLPPQPVQQQVYAEQPSQATTTTAPEAQLISFD